MLPALTALNAFATARSVHMRQSGEVEFEVNSPIRPSEVRISRLPALHSTLPVLPPPLLLLIMAYCGGCRQEDVFIGELKFDDKEGNVLGCLRFAFSQLGLDSKEDL